MSKKPEKTIVVVELKVNIKDGKNGQEALKRIKEELREKGFEPKKVGF